MFEQHERKKEPKFVSVIPLRDFHIVHNEHDIKLVKGEEQDVPNMFINNLKTEKVI